MESTNEAYGRGPQAVSDMKARIAALRACGADIVDVLWERHQRAILGEGYVYNYSPEPVRQDR